MRVCYVHPFTGRTHVRRFPCGKCGRVECGVEDADFRKSSQLAQAIAKEECEAHAAKRVRSRVNVETKE